ncbi:MAG: hypothetical protein U0930_18795 [Pirellulales bacterium]
MSKIPSDEAFARAERMMAEDFRGLADVSNVINSRCKEFPWFKRFYIIPQGDNGFRAYFFFRKDTDLIACKADGTTTAIEESVYEGLEQVGRGKRGEIVVAFEWDSDENVQRVFDGDYFRRLS